MIGLIKMSENIVDKETYELRRSGCAPADEIEPDLFYVEYSKLGGAVSDESFARELFVKIADKRDEEGLPTVVLELLTDDGEPLDTREVTLDPDGIIIGPEWEEKGYLVGGMPPMGDGQNITKEELFVPVEVRKPRKTEELPQIARAA
jgi:hypothetical protein